MTHIVVLKKENPQQCDMCGQIDELRPYGPKGEDVCFDCAKKNPKAMARQFKKRLSGQAPYGQDETV